MRFLEGDTDAVVAELERQMEQASEDLEFELAAHLRDRLSAVRKAIEKQQMVFPKNEDADVIGIHDELGGRAVFFVERAGSWDVAVSSSTRLRNSIGRSS